MHGHHYGDVGEPTITVILVVALAMALAMCRYWCREASHERRELRRRGFSLPQSRRRGRHADDLVTHHLVLQIPPNVESLGTELTPIEFTASAPRYSLVMQNPSIFTTRSPIRPYGVPETPPPPYPITPICSNQSLFPNSSQFPTFPISSPVTTSPSYPTSPTSPSFPTSQMFLKSQMFSTISTLPNTPPAYTPPVATITEEAESREDEKTDDEDNVRDDGDRSQSQK